MVRVVVVGATGNVGTSLIESLAGEPKVSSVLGLARRLPRWPAPKTEWASADISTDDLVPHFSEADVVVHLAWLFQPTHNPAMTWRVNALGSIRVFRAVADAGVPAIIYASSIGAYSPGPRDRPVDETWPTHGWPTAGYTREKAYVERVLDSFERDHPDRRVVRMRPAFIFKRQSASQQRRLFVGPLVPNRLFRPGLLPFLPEPSGLRFQAMHSADAGEAYRLAIVRPVRGAFNLAAEPVLESGQLAQLLGTRTLRAPTWLLRTGLAAAWRLHLAPAAAELFDAVLQLPIMGTGRARAELGWSPRYSSLDAMREFIEGLHRGSGMDTPPLAAQTSGRMRQRELRTGVGERP
jgi:UDP-glucose 4-epimerase